MDFSNISPQNPVVAWFSGGITSAVACKLAINIFGKESVRVVFIGTMNEDEDSYRFLEDCEKWYEVEIEIIHRKEYANIKEVWFKFLSLNVANGAICSSELKREVRMEFQRLNSFSFQVFGFDIDEPKRAKAMQMNYPESKPIFPLLLMGYSKKDCIRIVEEAGIVIPRSYHWGFNNNNCLQTGCVQGGIGYWQKMQKEFPDKFAAMAKIEHELTDLKGKPVTMLKDQSKQSQGLVFLLPHPNYPGVKDLSMMKGRAPKPLMDCNGFCGTNDLMKNETANELNYSND
jgi:hypothetical protein